MDKKKNFEIMTMDEQIDITWKGEFISSIKLKNYCLMLYLVEEAYYVEVFYDAKKKEILFITLAEGNRLALYSDNIKLDDLF